MCCTKKMWEQEGFQVTTLKKNKPISCYVLEIGNDIRKDRIYYQGSKCVRLIS